MNTENKQNNGWDDVKKSVESGPLGSYKWLVIGVFAIVILIGAISAIVRPASMAVDRIVQKNSLQYREGMEQRGAILQASIEEIDIALEGNPENRQDLINQKRILSAQLTAITINQ